MSKLLMLCLLLCSTSTFAVTTINGAGASFPYPIYSKWFAEYEKTQSDVRFNYQSIGSGGGIRQVLKGTVDFGASDAPMKDKELDEAKNNGAPIMHVPTVIGAVTVAYNVEGVKKGLKLDGALVADIFRGVVTKWNDPRIVKLNEGVKLPAKDILVVRRADGSGTTSVFSEYLCKVSPEWKEQIGEGKTLKWPVGIGSKGNEGVTNTITQTDGAIGYIELAYAEHNNVVTASIKNTAGEFVAPSTDSASLSAAGLKNFDGDLRVSITNADAKGAYPIASFTYILLPMKKGDAKIGEIKKFLSWAMTTGQSMATSLNYAPLPEKLSKKLHDQFAK